MIADLFRGQLVRLAAPDPERDAETLARWSLDSEYLRLVDSVPALPQTAREWQDYLTEFLQREDVFAFHIRTLAGDRFIGDVTLGIPNWVSGDAYVGIGIGERADWGKGYGTDAMRLALQYGFTELNLARMTLEVFANNPRAIRSYVKAGFKPEGVQREWLRRGAQRYDMISMGILRDDWLAARPPGVPLT
jgi:RimJ/RimL family protein N-acetyltransferase